MSGFLSDVLNALLGAQFSKVVGLAGLLFILLGVIPGEIRWGRLVLPTRDLIGRCIAILLGSVFVAVPLLGLFDYTNTIGLINVGDSSNLEQSINPSNSQPTSSLLIGTAPAGERADPYTVTQRTVVDISKSLKGASSAIYVGDVHLSDPTLILIFKSMGLNGSKIKNGKEFSETEIRGMLSEGEIVLLDTLKQGDQRTFNYNGNAYLMKIDKVIWYLFGDDIVNVSITPK